MKKDIYVKPELNILELSEDIIMRSGPTCIDDGCMSDSPCTSDNSPCPDNH